MINVLLFFKYISSPNLLVINIYSEKMFLFYLYILLLDLLSRI